MLLEENYIRSNEIVQEILETASNGMSNEGISDLVITLNDRLMQHQVIIYI